MTRLLQRILLLVLAMLTATACQAVASPTRPYGGVISIGHNAPFTGSIPLVALSGRDTITLWLEEQNNQIELNGETYRFEIIEKDNQTSPEGAAHATEELITIQNVLAIIGPYASAQAIPAGEVANRLKTPLISPWSTNPKTTRNRPYVFRIPFLDDFQAQVIAYFLAEEQRVENVAVLYSQQSDYSRDIARFFREQAEALGMNVVYDESFDADNLVNITPHLERLTQTNADVLFLPQYYNEVPIIVNQLAQLGWQGRIIGSDTWASTELLIACNVDCEGFYFTTTSACQTTLLHSLGTQWKCWCWGYDSAANSRATWKKTAHAYDKGSPRSKNLRVQQAKCASTSNATPSNACFWYASKNRQRNSTSKSALANQHTWQAVNACQVSPQSPQCLTEPAPCIKCRASDVAIARLLAISQSNRFIPEDATMTLRKGAIRLTIGVYERAVQERLQAWDDQNLAGRIWQRDASIWTSHRPPPAELLDRLGWLDLPTNMRAHVDEWRDFAETIHAEGFTHAPMPFCWAWVVQVLPPKSSKKLLATVLAILSSSCWIAPTPMPCVPSKNSSTCPTRFSSYRANRERPSKPFPSFAISGI